MASFDEDLLRLLDQSIQFEIERVCLADTSTDQLQALKPYSTVANAAEQ